MERIADFLEKKGKFIILTVIVIQCIFFIGFTFLFFYFNSEKNLEYKLYNTGCITTFIIFMAYFAHHSV